MKVKKLIICGATLLLACTLGTAAHASANTQNQNNNNNIIKFLEQPQTNHNQSQPNPAQPNHSNHQQPAKQPTERQFYSVRHQQRTNYYTRIATPRRHQKGYAIYANPYNTSVNSFRPVSYQRQLANRVIHVIREATVNNHLWINFRSKINGWIDDRGIDKSTRWFYVPLISQRPQLPSGCEITATTMMLQHLVGHRVNKMKLAREMPRSSNPNYGFVGSPYSASGWWIAPHGLMHLVNRYTHGKAFNMTGYSKRSIINQINKGIPVVIWVGYMDGFPNHALTIYGYTKHDFMYNDPWRDRRVTQSMNYLWAHHASDPLVAYGALSYRK